MSVFPRTKTPKRAVTICVGRKLNLNLRQNDTDRAIFEQVFIEGDLKLPNDATPVDFIIDVGAHIGCSSIFYALNYGEAKILAVEAEIGNFRALQQNVEQVENISVLHAAAFYRSGHVTITNPDYSDWGYRVGLPSQSAAQQSALIRAMTIDEIIRYSGFPHVDILKIDVEGAERDIFEHSDLSWLHRVRRITIELHEHLNPGCIDSFRKATSTFPHEIIKTVNNITWINKLPLNSE